MPGLYLQVSRVPLPALISSVDGTQDPISVPAADQTQIQSDPRPAGGGCGCSQHPHPAGDTMSPALPILFTILLLSARASGAPSYVVVSPAVLYHPHPATLWVHLSDLQGPVQLRVQLQGDSRTPPTTLLTRDVLEPHLHLNVTFPAPAPARGKQEIVALHVSIQGDSLNVSESKKVMLRALKPGIFIQTDKAVYKPGQEVKFRVVSLDKDLTPSNQKLPLVFLKDPSGNRIAQWREVTPRQGIVDLSLPLASEPPLGTYTISVERKSHSFSVEEYVLPKFEVIIHLPSVLREKDEKFPVEICGRYTYGKPVQGKVQADLCFSQRLSPYQKRKTCTQVTGQTEKNGCFSTEVSLAAFETIWKLREELEVKALLVEDGTGLEMKSTKSCKVLPNTVTITFEKPDHVYKPGLPYTGTIRLQEAGGPGLPQRQVLLSVMSRGQEKIRSFLTDSSGRASFQLDASGWSGRVSLRAQVNRTTDSQEDSAGTFRTALLTVVPYSSNSSSFLHIRDPEGELPCGHSQLFHVDSIFGKEALGSELKNLDLVFMVLAKGTITSIFRKELAPMAKLLVYVVLPNGEMVADSTEFSVAKCFPNQVKMAFSEARALPGAALRLQLEAAPGSLCAVRAVDRSVLLLKPEAELNAEAIYKALPEFNYPYSIQDRPPPCYFYWQDARMETYKLFQVKPLPAWASWVFSIQEPPMLLPSAGEATLVAKDFPFLPSPGFFSTCFLKLWDYSLLEWGYSSCCLWESAALKLFTNAKTREDCLPMFKSPIVGMAGPSGAIAQPYHVRSSNIIPELVEVSSQAFPVEGGEEPPAPRTYFPETWLWDLVPGGVSDELSLSAYVTAAMLELGLPTLGQLYWQRKEKPQKPSELSWAEAAPAEVEMTAYVLLAYLSQPSVSPADLGTASQIVRWLCKQQNPYGGFASTQDTVVALQALAKYAALTSGSNGDLTVTVTSPTGTVQDFVLDSSNRLVLQRAALAELPGTYRLQARGQGCALAQVTLRYNVPPPPSTGAFELRVETEPLPGTQNPQFLLRLWARYSGERPATNMVVIEVKLPSGYSPDKKSVVELKRQNLVKKVEVQPDQVTIYLEQLSKEEETFSFRAQQDFLVSNLQPATVSLYDYYETGDRVDVAYTAPPSSEEKENV
ncbi:hypothetical protein IHE44_0010152 [Lamprotornis superbus]|uniref:Alpha-2-macroglobulin-like protein 1 n=1 Tax=Lamprotornis superbus TaxID=245042 RepID=A0A835TR45_9PASS|nr:hypothetical protein IHE44_0010152 [Lamprotornis superbus]